MRPDPLIAAKLKINRAGKEIVDLQRAIAKFIQRNPYRVAEEIEPDGRHVTTKVWFDPVDPIISDSVGAIASDLRSALDKIACALARQHSKGIAGVHFPIASTRDEFLGAREQRKISKLSDDAKAINHRLKPYKGGNDTLWALNELGKPDIHHDVLIAVGGQITSFRSGPIVLESQGGQMAVFRGPAFRLDGGAVPLQMLSRGRSLSSSPRSSREIVSAEALAARANSGRPIQASREPSSIALRRFVTCYDFDLATASQWISRLVARLQPAARYPSVTAGRAYRPGKKGMHGQPIRDRDVLSGMPRYEPAVRRHPKQRSAVS